VHGRSRRARAFFRASGNPLTRDVGPRACAEGELMAGG
jgi:hypothetical protein